LKKHQREKKPCAVKEADSFQRDLSDGYDEEQAKKLKGRPRMLPATKWREWYGILFNVKPDSPEIPSPCKLYRIPTSFLTLRDIG
jgi:hypothetical protein